ncbi:MAG: DeoR/GlpR family DNA-binding transcription regulator [Bacteroidales bacterium]|jgi:DeoR/GlpR family transcriptional regulator of sugar metabolism|nr:DeoR/GlpR family DNA-binding transcription regulator [Bacteroidales bacterium]MDY6258508.1 DeoR/GlpR family DNA-binding transcription regulator [Bacteroidales bacterium]
MIKDKRHALIMSTLLKKGTVQVTELAEALGVSSVTVRKDLTELEKSNKLYRSHGRAILLNPFANNRSVNEKEKLAPEQKNNIGREAAKLICADDSICIGSGTTVHALARNIVPMHRLTVVSASLQVSEILAQNENIDIIQLGGQLRHSSLSVVGKYSGMILRDCSFSKFFIGVDGIDFDFGFSTTDLREAELNRLMMKAAQKTIVLADSSKFGRRGFAKIGDLEEIDLIITDSDISPKNVKRIHDLGIDLVIAQ